MRKTTQTQTTIKITNAIQQAAWLEAVFSGTREGILVTNADLKVRMVNYAALQILGMTEEEAIGEPLEVIFNRVAGIAIEWPTDANIGFESEIEFDGHHYHCSFSPVQVDESQDGGFVCVLTDTTALHRLNTLKTNMIQMASHDLRTPITSLRLQHHLLQREQHTLSEQHKKSLGYMNHAIDELQRMVNDLLDVEHIERQASGAHESTSIESLLTSAVTILKAKLDAKGHHLQLEITEDLPSIYGYPVQLLEVAHNLLTNAVKYTPDGGSIVIRAYAEGDCIKVEVKDNGIGIHPDDLPHVFDANFRTDEAIAMDAGTGLGLSLVKTIIEQHGGQVFAESEPGVGCTFGFSIPTSTT